MVLVVFWTSISPAIVEATVIEIPVRVPSDELKPERVKLSLNGVTAWLVV